MVLLKVQRCSAGGVGVGWVVSASVNTVPGVVGGSDVFLIPP